METLPSSILEWRELVALDGREAIAPLGERSLRAGTSAVELELVISLTRRSDGSR